VRQRTEITRRALHTDTRKQTGIDRMTARKTIHFEASIYARKIPAGKGPKIAWWRLRLMCDSAQTGRCNCMSLLTKRLQVLILPIV